MNGSVVDEMMAECRAIGQPGSESAGALESSSKAVMAPYSLAEHRQHLLPRHDAIVRPLGCPADVHVYR
jgi:hypothetical protein